MPASVAGMKLQRAVAAYSRVSTQRQSDEGMSLEMQRRAIAQYCAAMGLAEPIAYEDAGISAFKERIEHRPAFARLLADAEAGAIGTIVVASLDRWSRKLRVIDETLRRLDAAGVALISLREHIDYSTAVGKLTINMLGAIAQHTSDDRSEVARRVHATLKAEGKWDGGSPPFGAMLDADGRLTLDPTKADTLARMLELVATVSYHVAADNSTPRASPRPVPCAATSPAPRAAGGRPRSATRSWAGPGCSPSRSPGPARYLAAATKPLAPPVARTRTIRLLTGLMRCHACGHAVVYATSGRRNDGLRLRCETPGCKLNYGRADRHEAEVLARMMALRPREQPRDAPGIDHRAWTALAERRKRYASMFGRLEITEEEYEAARAELAAEEAALVDTGHAGAGLRRPVQGAAGAGGVAARARELVLPPSDTARGDAVQDGAAGRVAARRCGCVHGVRLDGKREHHLTQALGCDFAVAFF
jgi:putative DNA-invertase from lambdoid prophage Rac